MVLVELGDRAVLRPQMPDISNRLDGEDVAALFVTV
jgi:hypothetical protein